MAGHSQFKNIMYRKGAQDVKRAKIFTRLAREITVAARAGGSDSKVSARLRSAMAAARAANMPRDNIERAVQRGSGTGEGNAFESVRYEGFGPGGTAIIVDATTDNRKRTDPQIRIIFVKHGGGVGELNSVSFRFDQVGRIDFPTDVATPDAMFELAAAASASDVTSSEYGHECFCAADDFGMVREKLEASLGPSREAGLIWQPRDTVTPEEGDAEKLLRMIEVLDNHEDVQTVSSNLDLPLEMFEKLAGFK